MRRIPIGLLVAAGSLVIAIHANSAVAAGPAQPTTAMSVASAPPALPQALNSFDGLKAVALGEGDVAGYTQSAEDAETIADPSFVAGYFAEWNVPGQPIDFIHEYLYAWTSPVAASDNLDQELESFLQSPDALNVHRLGSLGIGDEDLAASFETAYQTRANVIVFRWGLVSALLANNSNGTSGSIESLKGAALAIVGRLAAAGAPSIATATLNPAASLVGQSAVLACGGLTAVIETAQWSPIILDKRSSSRWVYVTARVTNDTGAPTDVYPAAQLQDQDGHRFTMSYDAPGLAVYLELQNQLDVAPAWNVLQPGEPAHVLWVFDVPAETQQLSMVSPDRSCP